MEKERRKTSDCIAGLNKTVGNGTVHYNESVHYRSHGIGQCLEQEQLRVQWKPRLWKIAEWFFFQKFPLVYVKVSQAWDFLIIIETDK